MDNGLDAGEQKMKTVKNVICFESNVDNAVLTECEQVGLKVVTLDQVIDQGE